MGKRNKAVLSFVMWGMPIYSPTEPTGGYYWTRHLRREKLRVVKKRLNKYMRRRRSTTYLKWMKSLHEKFPIGALFNPCGAVGNCVIDKPEFIHAWGFLVITGFESKDQRFHDFSGCGDCEPRTIDQIKKEIERNIRYFKDEEWRKDEWWNGKELPEKYIADTIRWYERLIIQPDSIVIEPGFRPLYQDYPILELGDE